VLLGLGASAATDAPTTSSQAATLGFALGPGAFELRGRF